MKKIIVSLLVMSVVHFLSAAYNVGDTVNSSDNISWTISGPAGHPEVGNSSNIFEMVESGKPVMIFFGRSW